MIEPSAESLLFGRQGPLWSVSIVIPQLEISPLYWWAEKSLASQLHCSCSGWAFRFASLAHLFHFLVVSSFLAPVPVQDLPFCSHCLSYLHMHLCLILALTTAKARRSTGDAVSCPVAPSGCGAFSSFSSSFSLLSPLLRSFLPGHLSGFINIRRHSQCGSASIFLSLPLSCSHLLTAHLSLSVPPPPSLAPSLSFFPLPHCVRRWQLCSSGALRGAEKTKIWFSGSDLDFLQIGWKIRRSFYSYSTQSLPLQLQTMTADHRGCSYLHKCAICDKASLCFLPKTMTSGGTQCTEHRSQRNWCEMQDGKGSESKTRCDAHNPGVHITQATEKCISPGGPPLCVLSLNLHRQ